MTELIVYKECDAVLKQYLEGVEGIVEASDFERHCLWHEYYKELNEPWEQDYSGLLETVGNFGNMPICLSMLKATVSGRLILFYATTSMVVHYKIIEDWLEAVIPQSARLEDGRINKTDAMNFDNIFHNIRYRK